MIVIFKEFMMMCFVTALVLMLAIPEIYILRLWVYSSCFQGMSKNHKKKICKQYSWIEKVILLFTLGYKNRKKTMRRIIVAYIYYFFTLLLDSLIIAKVFSPALFDFSGDVYDYWMIFNGVICMYILKIVEEKR